jgi:hypothetical protein
MAEVIAKHQKGREKPMGQGVHVDFKSSNAAALATSTILNCQLSIVNFSDFAIGSAIKHYCLYGIISP